MNTSDRLQQKICTDGVTLLHASSSVATTSQVQSVTGMELAVLLGRAITLRDSLNASILSMSAALDTGETVEQRDSRIAEENANPKAAAEAHGWFAIEDFASLCDKSDTGFYNRIKDARGSIVKPRQLERLLGTDWPRYPGRSEFWGDYFDFADNWKAALAKVREAKAKEKRA